MPTVDKDIIINAPREKIFDFVNKPSNLVEIWPSLNSITNEQPLPNGGYSFQWEYRMAGRYFKGRGEYTGVVSNQWFSIKLSGPIQGNITWTFRSQEVRTRVTLTVEYHVPVVLIRWLTELMGTKMNEHEGEMILANLRTKFESR